MSLTEHSYSLIFKEPSMKHIRSLFFDIHIYDKYDILFKVHKFFRIDYDDTINEIKDNLSKLLTVLNLNPNFSVYSIYDQQIDIELSINYDDSSTYLIFKKEITEVYVANIKIAWINFDDVYSRVPIYFNLYTEISHIKIKLNQ
jgi:hypothetical protein